MISKMAFGVKPVREFLAANGCVLTVRGYDYTTTAATVPQLNDIRIIRSKVCEIKTIDDLNGFVPLSGFKTVSEWWVQIKRFCKGRMWLYRVTIDDNHISKMESDYEKREQQKILIDGGIWNRIPPETHPLDIRHESIDPADIDLQPFKEAAHADRIQRDARAAERKHERMRAAQQRGQMRWIPDPVITERRATQDTLIGLATAEEAHRAETIHNYIDDVGYAILRETDIDVKMTMLENLTHAREILGTET